MPPTVVIIGGGYGGSATAKALDTVADVILVEPKDAFLHTVGALRATVDPQFMPQVFFPYDTMLTHGQVVHDRAVRVEPGRVTLASGDEISADYLVLATGSRYPFPAKHDPVTDILSEYEPELREEVHRQLADLGVQLVLGSPLLENPPTAPGERGTFHVTTDSDVEITGDIWFRCFGVIPNTEFLTGALADTRWENGQIAVTDTLQVKGQSNVFSLGDITDIAEQKRASSAIRHAEVVTANIKTLITGEGELTTYQPGPPAILLPLGPHGGASQIPGQGVVGAETTTQYKSADLMTERFREMLFGTGTT